MFTSVIKKHILRLPKEVLNFVKQLLSGCVRGNNSKIGLFLRGRIYRTKCRIDTDVHITNPRNFLSGNNSALYHSCYILNTNGKFIIGNNSHLGAFCYVNVNYGNLTIGDNVAIGPGTKIIVYSNHYQFGKKVTDERIVGDITIGENVFVGANCTILPGTIIHDNIIIGAGSVVRGELEANSIYAGIPSKKLKSGWYE